MGKKLVSEIDFKYSWRGLHLDVARHAVDLKYIYGLLDKMQENHLNKLHLHLTDDQGWRIEIKKYPLLHEIGSKRKETVIGKNFPTPWKPFKKYKGDKKEYGFYYSQKELKDLDNYAKEKGVTIVPEIDLPGHSTALLFAYPEFAAGEPPKEVATYWGVFSNVVSDSPKTLAFLKDVFDELLEIFSGKYIHIGGDEVPLRNYDENIEPYNNTLKELALYLKSKGREVVMWEEAFDIAQETDSILMCWQSLSIGKEFLEKEGRVIFCPNEYFYFDYHQYENKNKYLGIGGYIPLEKVYRFSLEEKLGLKTFQKYKNSILGIQANLWTEYLNSKEKLDYMLYPRFYALAKVVNRENNNWQKFLEELKNRGF